MRPLLGILALALASDGCIEGPEVVQGRVVSFEPGKKLVLKDERQPQRELTLAIEGAQIGTLPSPGDTVRVAYRLEGSSAKATRIANISRQRELRGNK